MEKKYSKGNSLTFLISATFIFVIIAFVITNFFPKISKKSVDDSSEVLAYTTSKVKVINRLGTLDDLDIDICASDPAPDSPAVILLHGGTWSGGDKSRLSLLCRHLAELGYVAVNVNYRLVRIENGKDVNTFPAAFDDLQYLVRWLKQNSATYNIDPNKIIAWGESAGGNLAGLLGVRETTDNPTLGLSDRITNQSSKVAIVVSEFGPMNLANPFYQSNPTMKAGIERYLGATLANNPSVYANASPYTYVNNTSAKFLFIHGLADSYVPVSDSRDMLAKLRSNNIPSLIREYSGKNHNFIEDWEKTSNSLLKDLRLEETAFVRSLTINSQCGVTAKSAQLGIWNNNRLYARTIPIDASGNFAFNSAGTWLGPISPVGTLPGSGDVLSNDVFVYSSGTLLNQSFWRKTSGGTVQGYTRDIPIRTDGTPDWAGARNWVGPVGLATYLGSGEFYATDNVIIRKGGSLIQTYYRGTKGYIRSVPIKVSGTPDWNKATQFSEIPLNLPGTRTKQITAQSSIMYPNGTKLFQSFSRGDERFVRDVPVDSWGIPQWGSASPWIASYITDLPGVSGRASVDSQYIYITDCR